MSRAGRLRGAGVVALTVSALSPTASVFVTGSTIFRIAGTGAALAVLVGGAVMLVVALLVAELAGAFPDAGGVYPGIGAILGPGAARAVASLALVTSPALLAFLAQGFAGYAQASLPGLPTTGTALGVLAMATALACLHVRIDAWITGAALAAELLALVVLAWLAAQAPVRGLAEVILHPVMATGHGVGPVPARTVALAIVTGAFACSGGAVATFLAEELNGDRARIGRWVLVSTAIALATIGVPVVLVATALRDLTAPAPLAQFVLSTAGPVVATATTGAVALAIANNMVAFAVASSRLVQATGRDALWPRPIARRLAARGGRGGAPWPAVLALGAVAAALTAVPPARLLILLSGEVFTGALLIAAVLVGRRRRQTGVTSFRAPALPLVSLITAVAVAAFALTDWSDRAAGRPSLLLLGAVALAGCWIGRGSRAR